MSLYASSYHKCEHITFLDFNTSVRKKYTIAALANIQG